MENNQVIKSIGQAYQQVQEKLKGGQKKLDKDGDGDIDGSDFAMMRKKNKKTDEDTSASADVKPEKYHDADGREKTRMVHTKRRKRDKDKDEGQIEMNPKLDKGSKNASEQKEATQIDELSPGTLDSYTQKAQASKDALKKKAKAHKDLGNDAEAKAAKDKAKKRDAGQTKAYARSLRKKTGYTGEPGSAMRKAADKMPKSYTKESSEVSESSYGAMIDAKAHAKKDGKNYKDVSVQHKYDAYHMKKRGYTHFEPGSYGTRKYHKRPVAGGTKISGDHHSGVSEQNELAPKGMKMKKPNEQNELAPKGMKKKMGEDEVVMNPKKKKQTGEKAANSDSNMAQEDTKWPIYNRIMEKNVVNQNAVAPEQMIPADKKLKDDQSDVVNQSQDHISAAAAQWIKDHDGNQVPADAVDHEKVVAKNAQDAMRTVPNQAKDEVNKKAGKPENMTVTKEKK